MQFIVFVVIAILFGMFLNNKKNYYWCNAHVIRQLIEKYLDVCAAFFDTQTQIKC